MAGFRTSLMGSVALGLFMTFSSLSAAQAQQTSATVQVGATEIGGTVTGPKGPEAGVWVIAETHDTPVRYIKIVVTDDQGRFLVPDLPKGTYDVWVRGYGLIDSQKVKSEPGKTLSLTALAAPDEKAAAAYYPAIYWYSMLKIPGKEEFGHGNMPPKMDQQGWLNLMKNNGCIGCHQIGQLSTRTIPQEFGTGADGWMRRIQSGQAGESMVNIVAGELSGEPLRFFGDWTDRVAKGEVPHVKPERPQGVERNIVVTLREWSTPDKYLHDLISTDRRNPTVNGYGPLYGSPEYSTDNIPVLDPIKNTQTSFRMTYTPDTPEALGPGHAASKDPLMPSHYWGDQKMWDTHGNNHNSMIDGKGRVWLAANGFAPENPDYCKKGSDLASAKAFPIDKSVRRLALYDPKNGKYTPLQICFQTHHLQFGYDKNDTLWTSGGGPVIGWFNTKVYDETGDVNKAQGWTALVLDTNGNGKRDDYVEPNQPVDPTKDKRIVAGLYAVMPSPVDGSVWGTYRANPGAVVRMMPGDNPPQTALAEIYNVPLPGYGPRGGDIDKDGVVWVSLASGHLGSFDRRKCKAPLNGPKATGDHCPEGWSFYKYPGPGFEGIGDNSAESSYYTWVDQHNTFGLGDNIPMSTGNLNDGILALKDGKWVVLRVPYPLGFYAKGFDGRIDDPNGGWKARGLWTTNGDRTPWLIEGGKGTRPLATHFQIRSNPLEH
jgi:hypothetical protein